MKTQVKEHPLLSHPRPIYPWVIWILCNLFNFYLFLIQYSAWELRSYLTQENLLFQKELGTLLDPFIIAIVLFQIPVALLLDHFGPRKVTSVLIFIAAGGVLLFSYHLSPKIILIGNFLMGLGATVTYVNTFKLVSNWFLPEKFPVMVAWTFLASFIGAIVGQPLTIYLVKTFSWSSILMNYGIIGIIFSLIFFFSIRDQSYQIIPHPELFRLGAAAKKVFKAKQNYLLGLAYGLANAPWFAFTGKWHKPYYHLRGFTESQGLTINLLDLLAFPIGALLFALFAKKTQKRKSWIRYGLGANIILTILFIYVPPLPFAGFLILSLLTALSLSSITLCYTLVREGNILSIAATAIAVVTVLLAVFRLISDHLLGWSLTKVSGHAIQDIASMTLKDFQHAMTFIPISMVLAFICILFIKDTRGTQTLKQ